MISRHISFLGALLITVNFVVISHSAIAADAKESLSKTSDPKASDLQPVDNEAIANGLAKAATPLDLDPTHRAAFEDTLSNAFPFKPAEIHTIIQKFNENEEAIAQPPGTPPKAEIKAETISLEPGNEPREIDTDTGYVTAVSFLDATGNPWPILDIGVGGNFDVPAPEQGGNVLRITPLARYVLGNLSVRLVNLTTPISFKLRASSGTVYYRYDARIGKLGPNASTPIIDRGNDVVAGDSTLMSILDGAPPLESSRVTVNGVDTRTAAWRIGSKVYVRTPLTLLSPGWEGSVASGDGTRVYLISDTPVLLLSDNGTLVHARIGNNSKPDEEPVAAILDGRAHPYKTAATIPSSTPLITKPSDSVIPTPSNSRTLIRPVANQADTNSTTSGNPNTNSDPSTSTNLSGTVNQQLATGPVPTAAPAPTTYSTAPASTTTQTNYNNSPVRSSTYSNNSMSNNSTYARPSSTYTYPSQTTYGQGYHQ